MFVVCHEKFECTPHERKLEPQELPEENMRQLRELFTWQQQLTTRISTLKIQLQQSRNSFVQNDMEELLKSDQKKLKSVEDEIARYIHDDPDTDEKDEILQSVPGVGPKTSYAILVTLPEIGKLAPRAASSLAGVAPMNCDSGKKRVPATFVEAVRRSEPPFTWPSSQGQFEV